MPSLELNRHDSLIQLGYDESEIHDIMECEKQFEGREEELEYVD